MNSDNKLPRRTFLHGVGASLALPFLEAMIPHNELMGRAFGAPKTKNPRRVAFFYVPNGIHMKAWEPEKVGNLPSRLPELLRPLTKHRKDMLLLGGLTQDKARANGDGPGDHARAASAFLTGAQPYKTGGKDIRVGVSIDQYIAQKIGKKTPFASLELGTENGRQSGSCDSGYSCAYSNNVSWKTESLPMAKETDPRQLFERLFPSTQDGKKSEAELKYRRKILDLVLGDAKKLKGKLGATDSRKVDEYLEAVFDIEDRIARAEEEARQSGRKRRPPPGAKKLAKELPDSRPKEIGERIRLMGDLLVLAFQADLTRVATFMFANEGSNRSYRQIGVPDGHHDVSHHGKKQDKQEKIQKINAYHMQQFVYIVNKLASTREGSRRLLDNSMLVYGSGISDGNSHSHSGLPILMVGKGGGTLKTGKYRKYPKNTPLNNLFLSLADRMGAPCRELGDSRGPLKDLY